MQQKKNQSFLQGAMVLVAATMAVKLIGALFKIPLQWLIGDDGMGIFSVAYQFFTTMLVVSTAGVPAALSKMVAESVALGREREAKRITKLAAIIFFILGAVCAAILFFMAGPLTEKIGNPLVYLSIRMIAPAVFFVAIISVIRGYYQGLSNMVPTGVSQIIEAAGKLVFGLTLGAWAMHRGMELTVCTAMVILGITISEATAALLLVIYMARDGRKNPREGQIDTCASSKTLLKRLMLIVIPITLTSSVTSLTTLIDSVMLVGRLQDIGNTLTEANLLFGMYSGKAMTMFNLPQTIVTAVATAVLPAIAGAYAGGKFDRASETMGSAMRITMLIAMPCFAGYFVLAEPIIDLLFVGNVQTSGQLLRILSLALPAIALVGLTNAILQAVGDVKIPLISMLLGSAIKVVLNHTLVGIPKIGIFGAPFGTLACYLFIAIVNLYYVGRRIRLPSFGRLFVRPFAACVGMAAAAMIVFRLLSGLLGSSIAVLAAIVVAGVVYLVLLLALGALVREDVLLLPKGDKLVKLLHIK